MHAVSRRKPGCSLAARWVRGGCGPAGFRERYIQASGEPDTRSKAATQTVPDRRWLRTSWPGCPVLDDARPHHRTGGRFACSPSLSSYLSASCTLPPRRPLRPARTHAWLAGWLRACGRLPLRGVGWTDDTAASRKYEDSCALHDPHQLKLVRAGAESGWGEDVHAVRPYSLDRINPPPPASGSMRVSASRILRSSSTFQKRAYICVFLQSSRDGTPPTIM